MKIDKPELTAALAWLNYLHICNVTAHEYAEKLWNGLWSELSRKGVDLSDANGSYIYQYCFETNTTMSELIYQANDNVARLVGVQTGHISPYIQDIYAKFTPELEVLLPQRNNTVTVTISA